jgi:hypothetical protein
MVIIRGARAQAEGGSGRVVPSPDPLQEHAARMFADELASARVPSIRAIRAQLHVGQPRAQRYAAISMQSTARDADCRDSAS